MNKNQLEKKSLKTEYIVESIDNSMPQYNVEDTKLKNIYEFIFRELPSTDKSKKSESS